VGDKFPAAMLVGTNMASVDVGVNPGKVRVTFLSDYRTSAFGSGTGVLQEASRLLARGVMVVDQQNVIRHLQVLPDQSQLPNMKEAARVATLLLYRSVLAL
jgi:alkyl hydroperoxide reductase subunit AhpC